MKPAGPHAGVQRRSVLACSGALWLPMAGVSPAADRPYRIALVPDRPNPPQGVVEALRRLGRIEGRDYVFVRTGVFYGPDTERAVGLAVESRPDLLLTYNLGYAVAAQRLTKKIPIVMQISGFPVEGGVADSLARPGRNVTGLSIYAGTQVFGKLVQLLTEARPGLRRIAALCSYVPPFNPVEEARPIMAEMRDGGRRLGIDVRVFEIARPDDVTGALAAVTAERLEALLLTSGVAMAPRREDVLRRALEARLPTITDFPWTTEGRPLLTYGASWGELEAQAADYIERILWQGAKPGDLPIQLPSKFVLTANLKTARAIGLELPQSILVRADRIEE